MTHWKGTWKYSINYDLNIMIDWNTIKPWLELMIDYYVKKNCTIWKEQLSCENKYNLINNQVLKA